MEKIWLSHYPQGVPATINTEQYATLTQLLTRACERYDQAVVCSSFGCTLTYASLLAQARDFAAYCQQTLKLKQGERIALMMPNCLQYPVVLLGALQAGLVVTNVNPLYTAKELKHQLCDADARAVVILENFAHVLESVLPDCKLEHVIVTELGDRLSPIKGQLINFVSRHVKRLIPAWTIPKAIRFNTALKQGREQTLAPVQTNADDCAFLQYTGGTTGVAKGAMLTHANMVANVLQAQAWIKPFTTEGKEVIITALPLYHIFSLTVNLLTFMLRGGHNVLIANPRDMSLFIRLIKKIRFTAITGVNTLFNGMMNHSAFHKIDFSQCHLSLGGGMAVQEPVANRWQRLTGTTLVQAYGLTETCPAVAANPLNITTFNPAVGLPVPNTDIRVCNDAGEDVALGEAGELWVSGPQVMKGYWQKPEETANVLHERWFKTGDIVSVDDKGFIHIVDRKKDMIIVSGFNVYPNEVEAVIAACPGVDEVGVIGQPDEASGELVKAFIVKRNPDLCEAEVIHYCRENLTAYKVPKQIQFCNTLPKSPVGKILRRELRDLKDA